MVVIEPPELADEFTWPCKFCGHDPERSALYMASVLSGLKRVKYSVVDRMTGDPEPSMFYTGANMEVDYINEAIDKLISELKTKEDKTNEE